MVRCTHWKRIARGALFVAVLGLSLLGAAQYRVLRHQRATTNSLEQLPSTKACLVLGASKVLPDGRNNLFFKFRMEAAARVFHAGKCSVLVVSGDNRFDHYNEPEDMRTSLIEHGVPADRIHADYAGGRTLDSVVRFKRIFGQTVGIVISQRFHNARAAYIAEAHGITLHGFNAKDVHASGALRTVAREVFSRLRAVLDVEVLRSEPKHGGASIAL
jgi:SanA protein